MFTVAPRAITMPVICSVLMVQSSAFRKFHTTLPAENSVTSLVPCSFPSTVILALAGKYTVFTPEQSTLITTLPEYPD